MSEKRKRVLAVASCGGHWEQMMLLRRAFRGSDAHFVTTLEGLSEREGLQNASVVPDCNRNKKLQSAWCCLKLIGIIARFRPHVVVTTGAAPGILALTIGRFFGAKTVWIDSVANVEHLSLSGKIAGRVADLQLTQWAHLAAPGGPEYFGGVL